MRTLTAEQMSKMQTIMHNSMAGFDISAEMAQFESTLPSSFREKLARIMYMANGIEVPPVAGTGATVLDTSAAPANENDARLVILKSVAQGLMAPEEALNVLFPNH